MTESLKCRDMLRVRLLFFSFFLKVSFIHEKKIQNVKILVPIFVSL